MDRILGIAPKSSIAVRDLQPAIYKRSTEFLEYIPRTVCDFVDFAFPSSDLFNG